MGWGEVDKVVGRQRELSLNLIESLDLRHLCVSTASMGARWEGVLVGLFWGRVPSISLGFSELLDSEWVGTWVLQDESWCPG